MTDIWTTSGICPIHGKQKYRYVGGSLLCRKCKKDNKYLVNDKEKAVHYLGKKCIDCGLENDCFDIYDIHHRDPKTKKYDISKMLKHKPWNTIQTELNKCDLLCAICHRKRHATKECCKRKPKQKKTNKEKDFY